MKVYISVDFEGISGSTSWQSTNLGHFEHASLARELIREGARRGVLNRSACHLEVPDTITMEIGFKDHWKAKRASYYPGVEQLDGYTVSYTTSSMDDLMRARMFIL